jgi:hypothetical protein
MTTKTHLVSGLFSEMMTTTTTISQVENGTSIVYTNQVTQVTPPVVTVSIPAPMVLVCRPFSLLWTGLVNFR